MGPLARHVSERDGLHRAFGTTILPRADKWFLRRVKAPAHNLGSGVAAAQMFAGRRDVQLQNRLTAWR